MEHGEEIGSGVRHFHSVLRMALKQSACELAMREAVNHNRAVAATLPRLRRTRSCRVRTIIGYLPWENLSLDMPAATLDEMRATPQTEKQIPLR